MKSMFALAIMLMTVGCRRAPPKRPVAKTLPCKSSITYKTVHSGYWDDPSIWKPQGVPTFCDIEIIESPYTVILRRPIEEGR